MDFINIKISESYNGNIGQGIFLKKLLMLNHEQKSNSNVKYNQEFLEKKLGEIFSELFVFSVTSGRFSCHTHVILRTCMIRPCKNIKRAADILRDYHIETRQKPVIQTGF